MPTLAEDWITLWHSELAALADDREAAETWQAAVALWAQAARLSLAAAPCAHDPTRGAGAAASPGAAPPAAAPDARGDAGLAASVEQLAARLGELERRLERLEPRDDVGGAGKRRRGGGVPARPAG